MLIRGGEAGFESGYFSNCLTPWHCAAGQQIEVNGTIYLRQVEGLASQAQQSGTKVEVHPLPGLAGGADYCTDS
jgi:hypothetical protein